MDTANGKNGEEGESGDEVVMEWGCTGKVRLLSSSVEESELGMESEDAAAAETMLLWGIQQPTLHKPNSFVAQNSLQLRVDACGHSLTILQSPSSLMTPGVTGSVMWDSGVVLGKFLEHAVDSGMLLLRSKKVVELGSGCGLVGCIAALLGAQVFLSDLPDRLRLLKKNVETNLGHGDLRGSAIVEELIWGDDPDPRLIEPLPDYVVGSDVIYSEGAVGDLLDSLLQLCGTQTTILLAGELHNAKNQCCSRILRSSNERFSHRPGGSNAMESRLLQQQSCHLRSRKKNHKPNRKFSRIN